MFYVYMLECADTTLYVGSTSNVLRRVRQHNHAKSGAHYTKIRRPVALVYQETYETYTHSRAREAQLKRLTREQKITLINQAHTQNHV